MGQALYLECNSGISGDMTVAALLDLGAQEDVLRHALDSMPLQGFEIEISRVKKAGLDLCDFLVKLDREQENRDHDMEYLHGHEHGHGEEDECGHQHGEEDEYGHQHGEEDEHGHQHGEEDECGHQRGEGDECGHQHGEEDEHGHDHEHEHRGLQEIRRIIAGTDMTERARTIAGRIFDILAAAEAKAHGVDIHAVHFHEVGAVDSIVDVVAAAVCFDNLGITDVIIPYLCEGMGTVRCQHGILPVPVPAVANIVQDSELALQIEPVFGEFVTPTGAAIAAALQTKQRLPERFFVRKIGMGAGKRTYERPSILRAMLIETEPENWEDEIVKLETNVDDCTGEMLGYVMERLYEHGAKDVCYTPVFMKKNRPAYQLTVICEAESVKTLEHIIFRETTTIGIRRVAMARTVLERKEEFVDTGNGKMRVKRCTLPDGTVRRYPEYESAVQLAERTGKPLQDILNNRNS